MSAAQSVRLMPIHFSLSEETVGLLVSKALQIRPEVVALRDEVNGAQRQAAAERDARLPRVEALGSAGRTTVGNSSVLGNYAAAGINVEVPLWTGGLLSARQNEATLRASAQQKSLEQEENQGVKEVNSSWFNAFYRLEKHRCGRATCGECAASLGVGRRGVPGRPDFDYRTKSGGINCSTSRNRRGV